MRPINTVRRRAGRRYCDDPAHGATTPFELTQDHHHDDVDEAGYAIAFTEADDCPQFG